VTADTSAPARPRTRVLAQARFESGTLLRNGEQLLVSIVLPAIALVGLAASHVPDLGPGRRIDVAVPGVLALAVVSTAFTGQAIATGFDRRYGVLRLLGVTPLGRDGLLLGKSVAVLLVEAVQLTVLAALGLALGWEPSAAGVPAAVVTVLLGSFAFVSLALLLAGTLRAEAVLAVANLVWVLLLGLGLLLPSSELPGPLTHLARALPSGALGDGMRTALLGHGVPLLSWAVLLAWGVGASVLATRTFRWSD
jgi:ABC-2 type transport system permease protein